MVHLMDQKLTLAHLLLVHRLALACGNIVLARMADDDMVPDILPVHPRIVYCAVLVKKP